MCPSPGGGGAAQKRRKPGVQRPGRPRGGRRVGEGTGRGGDPVPAALAARDAANGAAARRGGRPLLRLPVVAATDARPATPEASGREREAATDLPRRRRRTAAAAGRRRRRHAVGAPRAPSTGPMRFSSTVRIDIYHFVASPLGIYDNPLVRLPGSSPRRPRTSARVRDDHLTSARAPRRVPSPKPSPTTPDSSSTPSPLWAAGPASEPSLLPPLETGVPTPS